MLKYRRIYKDENGIMRYEFYPEGDESSPGVVEFTPQKEPIILKDSELDIKRYYAVHALTGIDKEKESGTVAWY